MPTTTTASATVADALARFRAGESVEPATPVETPTAPPAASGGKLRRIAFPRPNGELYYSRKIPGAGHDVDMLRQARGATIADNVYVLYYGDPGTGKTACVEAAHPENLVTFLGDGDTTADDFLGSWVQNPDGSYEWVDGPLVVAAENGWVLFIDEISLIDSKSLAPVYGAMDGRGKIQVKTNPRRGTITVKDGFTVIGACNPNAPGSRMSEALLSRFTVHLEATTDYDLAKAIGVPAKMITIAKNLAAKKASDEVSWAPQMRELLAFKRNVERWGNDFAAANIIGIAPEGDRAIVADMVSRGFGSAVAPLRQGEAATTES